MKKTISLLVTFLALSAPIARAEATPIGSELRFIEGPLDLVQSLRDSFAAGRPKKQKPARAQHKAKQQFAAAKRSQEQEKD